jgi:hypothetical protein
MPAVRQQRGIEIPSARFIVASDGKHEFAIGRREAGRDFALSDWERQTSSRDTIAWSGRGVSTCCAD